MKKTSKTENNKESDLLSTSIQDKKRGRLFIDPNEPTFKEKMSSTQQQPILDRFGLPIITAENIFPPLPPHTEIIGTDPAQNRSLLHSIRNAMKSYIPINFDIFDDYGMERKSQPSSSTPAWKLKLLHQSPPVLYVENFLTPHECQECISLMTKSDVTTTPNSPTQVNSATFASTYAISKRTSTSWFCHYVSVPTFLAKAKRLLHLSSLDPMEEPQLVRYRTGEEFSWHYDEIPTSQLDNGGQRVATLLVYLNTLASNQGGGTIFRDLKDSQGHVLSVQPNLGDALLFFPAFANGQPDDRTLHKGEVAWSEKRIIQMWIHKGTYTAVLPQGNQQEDAIPGVLSKEKELGYI
jgi:hypothetical protein